MNKTILATAMTLALGALGAGALNAGEARAEAIEFFKCTMAEGATIEALVEMADGFEAVTAENGVENLRVAFLTPLYSSDVSEGTFYWVALAGNYSSVARANEVWDSDAGAATRARWDELVSDCESSTLYSITFTPNEGDED